MNQHRKSCFARLGGQEQFYVPWSGVEIFFGQSQAQGFLNPSPVSNLPSPNLQDKI
jgi:hypothetical protein